MGDLKDKIIVITGGNTGLGLATAKALSKYDLGKGRLIIACRDIERG
jgi:NAD(P)-dependent dehydrogenase (short-subunit alcohol dehydrogenase family)